MGCNCANRWTRWATTGDNELVMVEVESKCEPTQIMVVQRPDGAVAAEPPVGFGHDTLRPAGGAATSEPAAVPLPAPCKVTYVIKNSFAADFNITSFSTGADSYVFAPPIGKGQTKTVRATSSLPGPGECYRASTGTLELVHESTAARMTIGEIKICRLREPE
jgi:hypothetical protein